MITSARQPIQSYEIPGRLRSILTGETPAWGAKARFVVQDRPRGASSDSGSDFVVEMRLAGETFRFAAIGRPRSSPKVLESAIGDAVRVAEATGLRPMVVVPYLNDRQTTALLDRDISGIDLSGNGVIVVPDRLLLYRAGSPNRFPESQPVRFAYRGVTSIIPRVFLARSQYPSFKAILAEIAARGGAVAPSTVSKALARMEEDVLIRRDEDRIVLLQPAELLERLAQMYDGQAPARFVDVRTDLSLAEICAKFPPNSRFALTGASSWDRYAVGARGDVPAIYCELIRPLQTALGSSWNETARFADLRLVETRRKEFYFDLRKDPDGIPVASPVQTFIELANSDKRDRQIADQVRTRILESLRATDSAAQE